ncbi:hypothetical protein L1987_75283 [Smallanthus sonchifolius]|uniref:Uncharacterized protein n=1 Tax=Smallanthus sonchifolius TaxID=185202 RepID=A0ACB9A489_9ASTR|nr:hypothetical protein L1987_75283 [Smallanthus sonchifolius]
MNNHEKQQSLGDGDIDDLQKSTEDSSSVSRGEAPTDAVSGDSSITRNGNGIGLAARLTDLFVGDGDNDVDLLIQRSDQGTVMQWLHLQVMGACRADERLKPLLKLNVSSGVAEDRLLSHLSQHFEPSEVGLLARCLCVPLVSVRVGRIDKQGTLLIPNSARGNLTLSLLPTSDLRISFLGDDGHAERLSTLRNISDCSSVVIEGISRDNSGLSFIIKVPTSSKHFYFWCSEKSRLLGNELLDKMKNLLKKKPSLADLTGISDSRLECFVTHLRTYLVGSNTQVNNTALVSLTDSPSTTSLDLGETGKSSQSASLASKSSRGRILSPRSSSFKEGLPKNLVSLKNVAREKFRRKGEAGTFSSVDTFSVSSPSCTNVSTSSQSFNTNIPEPTIDTHMFPLVIGLEVGLPEKTIDTPALNSTPPISPYYCWCLPVAPTLQYTVAPSQITPMSMAESFTLPPLASLLASSTPISSSSSSSSLLLPKTCLTLDEIPPFLPELTVRLPIPMPTSQQIPIFTPLMTDPIVHIPVIDICSSGQAYLVSAGPAMSITIPPLHQARISPLIQEADSMAEKSARDTLRLLIRGSSQLPSVLANVDGNQNLLASGSRGLYGRAMDVNHAIANSIAAMGMVSLSEKSSDLVNLLGETVDSGGTCSSNDDSDLGAEKSQ